MALSSSLVFVTPDVRASNRFAMLFSEAQHEQHGPNGTTSTYSWLPAPVNPFTPYVYVLDVRRMDPFLEDRLEAEPWPPGTVLYIHHEWDDDGPRVRTW